MNKLLEHLGIRQTQRTVKQQISVGLALLIVMTGSALVGAVGGIYYATGDLPGGEPQVIVPEVSSPTTTLVEIGHFLERDKTDEIEYREGFNCLDYGLLVKSNAHWKGLPAELGGLIFEGTSIGHAILIFPTEEDGWVFVDPQSDQVINPRIGMLYNGNRIIRIDILKITWEPFMEEE